MNDDRRYWLDDPRNVDKIVYAVVAICLLIEAADLLYHKHPHFAFETIFGFYGIFGFVSCVALVLAARVLRKVVMRDEEYYD